MTPRVFVPPPCAATVTLDARRSHHLVRVLRIRAGDALEIFDGAGRVWQATVGKAETSACTIERGSLICEEARPEPEIQLAPALLRSDAMDRMLRQATELGADGFWPLATGRTQMARNRAEARHEHWRRVVIGACEQSRRAHLPRLNAVQRFEEFIEIAGSPQMLLLHPEAQPLPREPRLCHTMLLVGPEGGWTDEEVERARRGGIEAFSLGPGVLRAETAPLAAIAAIRHCWGWR